MERRRFNGTHLLRSCCDISDSPRSGRKDDSIYDRNIRNPSSIHFYGRQTRHAVDEARRACARSIHANPNEIIFTSGGTEADNLALIGVARANRHKGNHIITTQIEHHAILHTCELLEREGFEVTYLPVDETGRVQVSDIQKALTEETILVSIMFGNNEVGTMQPIAK